MSLTSEETLPPVDQQLRDFISVFSCLRDERWGRGWTLGARVSLKGRSLPQQRDEYLLLAAVCPADGWTSLGFRVLMVAGAPLHPPSTRVPCQRGFIVSDRSEVLPPPNSRLKKRVFSAVSLSVHLSSRMMDASASRWMHGRSSSSWGGWKTLIPDWIEADKLLNWNHQWFGLCLSSIQMLMRTCRWHLQLHVLRVVDLSPVCRGPYPAGQHLNQFPSEPPAVALSCFWCLKRSRSNAEIPSCSCFSAPPQRSSQRGGAPFLWDHHTQRRTFSRVQSDFQSFFCSRSSFHSGHLASRPAGGGGCSDVRDDV